MPKNPPFALNRMRRIEILAFPDVQLLDVAGPLQLFASVNDRYRAAVKPSRYEFAVVASAGVGVAAVADDSAGGDTGAGTGTGRTGMPRSVIRPCLNCAIGGRALGAIATLARMPRLIEACARSMNVASPSTLCGRPPT